MTILRQLSLLGGVSGAKVYLVKAEVSFPALEGEVRSQPLKFVIKFSSGQDFQKEKQVYEMLPERLKRWFGDFSTQRRLVDGDFFMIMPHLGEHETLAYIVYHRNRRKVEMALTETWEALEDIHFGKEEDRNQSQKMPPSSGKLSSMYFTDIHHSIQKTGRLSAFFPTIKSKSFEIVDGSTNESITLNHASLHLNTLSKSSDQIAPCFSMWSHGDCHARNIMIRQKDKDLKFIDIDEMRYDGDYIYDFGTLLADIEIYNRVLQCRRPNFNLRKESSGKYSYTLPRIPNADFALQNLTGKLQKLAESIDDFQWKRRLDLAKGRYLLSMSTKTIDHEKAFIVYCEGMKSLSYAAARA